MTNKLTKGCEEVLERIERHFGFLVSDYGSEIIYQRDAKIGERCLFVLETRDFRLRFISEFGGLSVDVGGLDAEPTWGSTTNEGLKWFPLRGVISFIEGGGRPSIAQSRAHAQEIQQLTNEEYDAYLAKQLRGVCSQLGEAVSEDLPSSRRQELEAYFSG